MALKKYYYPVILIVVAMAAWSCGKYNDVPDAAGDVSQLNVINAVTDIRAIDLYLNGTRQNNTSAIYLFNSSGYLSVPTGEQQYQFKSDTDRSVLADIKLNPVKADSSYTMLLTGQQSRNNLTTIFISDYFPVDSSTPGTNAQIRFVQASPGATPYDILIGDTLSATKTVYDTVSFKNKLFKAVTPFKLVKAGTKTIKIIATGTTKILYNATAIIQPGSYYTLYTEGLPTGTGLSAFGAAINLTR
jgi:hypothetical protein